MGEAVAEKLLAFLKHVEREQPDIICLQETANKVVPMQGYNHYVASGKVSHTQHGAVTYVRTTLGEMEQVKVDLPNVCHLKARDMNLDIYNVYIAPMYR